MSTRTRQITLFAVLAIVLIVRASLGQGSREAPEPFGQDVTVAVAAAPNIYANEPDIRVHQLIDSMNDMWARAFAAAGDDYEEPRIEPRTAEAASKCGTQVAGWAGVYCPYGKRIVIDVADHRVRRAAVGDEGSDLLLGYVLAHEVGHHVQHERELGPPGSQEAIVRGELHAQCLAGVWGRAAGRPLPPVASYAADGDHGTVEQQRHWLELGHASGRPAACDPVWSTAL